MAELDDTTFAIGMALVFTQDEEGRENMIARMCEKGFEREKVAAILDALHEMYRKDPLDNSGLDPRVRMAFARRIAELSGKTVEQVLAENNVFGVRKGDG